MKENEAQEHPSSAEAAEDGQGEEVGDTRDTNDQRWQDLQMQHLLRNESIRLLTLSVGLLALLVGFLLYLFTGIIFPLFATMVVVYLGYRRINAWLDTANS
jgi:hypothetical protein